MCHLGKVEQHVRSPWISLVVSRAQNSSWENRERGLQNQENDEKLMVPESIKEGVGDVQESFGLIWNDFQCTWMLHGDFQISWNSAPRWRLRTPNDHQKHKFVVLAQNSPSCFITVIKTWCEALSSRSPGGARLPKCPCVTFTFLVLDFGRFSGIITWLYSLIYKCVTLGK